MRLFPRNTLLWRTFILIALLIVLSLAAWFQIFTRFEQEPRARQLAQMLVSIVNLTRASLINADPLLRLALLRDLSEQEGIRVYAAEPNDRIVPVPDTPVMRIMVQEVRRQLGPQTQLAIQREGVEGIWVSFQIDPTDQADTFWVMVPSDRLQRVRTAEWIGWVIAAGLLALGGAYLIVRRIARPLAQLAEAARCVGRGEAPPPLPEGGPRELAEVGRAFNQMSIDLGELESDRALILAGISHDLRTPLARLRLGIEMTGAAQEDVDAMSTDIEEMDRIISQFLDFARGSADEASAEIDASALLTDIGESYLRRGFDICIKVPPVPQPFMGRAKALRRALSNLIDNALRYAGSDSEVTLDAQTQGSTLTLAVLDRGPGIPAAEVERLKRPFTRLEAARTDAQGSGLGLAIVERLARAHGGHLDLLPREGGGLAAHIVLPVTQHAHSE